VRQPEQWARFQNLCSEQLERVRQDLLAARGGALTSPVRQRLHQELTALHARLRAVGLGHASSFTHSLLQHVGHQPPDVAAALQTWVWLRRELDRTVPRESPAATYEQTLRVKTENVPFLDALVLSGYSRGWRVHPLEEGEECPPTDAVLFRQNYADTLRSVQTAPAESLRVAMVERLTFQARVELSNAGAALVLGGDHPVEAIFDVITRARTRHDRGSRRLLLVEDEAVTAKVMMRVLTRAGYEVTWLTEPELFWERLESVRPHMLILDYMLPGMLGAELCRALRSDPRWGSLPVLFFTSSRDAATVRELFAAGADDFVGKPVDPAELLGRIRNRLSRSRELRFQGDVDPGLGIAGLQASLSELDVRLAMARRDALSTSLALLRVPDRSHFRVVADACRRHLRRPADVLGRFRSDTLVLCFYDTPRRNAHDVLTRIVDDCGDIAVQATVAAYPADGDHLAGLLAALEARLAQTGRGVVSEAQQVETGETLVALVQPFQLQTAALISGLQALNYRVDWVADAATLRFKLNQPQWQPRLLVLDAELPRLELDTVLNRTPAPVVLLSDAPPERALRWLEQGAKQVFRSDLPAADLLSRLQPMLESAPQLRG
jgi:DNA-binding response OmpR family regulator